MHIRKSAETCLKALLASFSITCKPFYSFKVQKIFVGLWDELVC